jgi:lysozyme family protein
MPKVNLTNALAEEYLHLFQTLEINPSRFSEVDALVDKVVANKTRYEAVGRQVRAPWFFVGAIHNMESGLRMDRHLHNGDPLTQRTRHVPAGRPGDGNPPFTWQASAVDALRLRRVDRVDDWSLHRILYELEGYNGWGYRLHHPHVKSPYLWSFSNQYTCGKYIADGTWSDSAVSGQCGAVVLVKRLEQRGEITVLTGPIAAAARRCVISALWSARGPAALPNTFPKFPGWTAGPATRPPMRCGRFRLLLAGDPGRNMNRLLRRCTRSAAAGCGAERTPALPLHATFSGIGLVVEDGRNTTQQLIRKRWMCVRSSRRAVAGSWRRK